MGFPSSQIVVLECLQRVFPTAQVLLDQSETPLPSKEQLLALYFMFNSKAWTVAYESRGTRADLLDAADEILSSIANAECDHHETHKIVSDPQIGSLYELQALVRRYGETWVVLRNVFPFLNSRTRTNGKWTEGWGIF